MNVVVIGGKTYNVHIVKIKESFTVLYTENTGRTMSVGARMALDPLGTFFNHEVTFRCRRGYEDEFDELYDVLSRPRDDGLSVEMVHNQTTLNYDAYVSSGERSVKRIDEVTGKIYWDEFTSNFIAMEAQVVPE